MGTSLLEVTMIRPGTGVTSSRGRKTVWSTPTGTTVIRSGATPICAAMSVREFCETVTTAGRARATRTCMPRKPNQRRVVKRCHGFVVWDSASWRSTVIGWCSVVSSGHPSVDHAEHAGAEALVVVDDVELVAALGQQPAGPQREGQRLAEAGRAHDAELEPVLPRGELARVRDPERVGVAVEVEPGHGGEADALVELGPRRPGEHLDASGPGRPARGSGGGCRRPGRRNGGCPGR